MEAEEEEGEIRCEVEEQSTYRGAKEVVVDKENK